jgi:hypothetical protein
MLRGWGVCVAAVAICFGSVSIARAAVMMPVFGPASRVTQLNAPSPYNDVPTWASADGLSVVISSNRNESGHALFSATRASTAAPFSAPVTSAFVNNNLGGRDIGHAVLSPDGLEMFYSDHQLARTPPTLIMRASRANAASPFSAGTPVAELMLGTPTYPSYLSSDGLRLYLFKPFEDDALVATRASVGAAFGTPSAAPFVNIPYIQSPYLSGDELQMFFSFDRQLWWTSRASTGTAFDPPQALSSVTVENMDAPVFFGGDSLLFYGAPGGLNGDIWVARIPEPAGVTLLTVAGGLALGVRRRGRGNALANCG